MTDEERVERDARALNSPCIDHAPERNEPFCGNCQKLRLARFALAVLDLPYVSHGGTNTYIIGRNDGVSETKKAGLAAAFREVSDE